MRPDQLADIRIPSDPRMHPDGVRAAFVVTDIDVVGDRYVKTIWLWDGTSARPITSGPTDSAPRWSPDGTRLAFLRRGEGDDTKTQVAVMRVDGGEASLVTDFPLGAFELEWDPSGDRIAVVAGEWCRPDLEKDERSRRPRRITELPARFDGRGWLNDRRNHVWIVDVAGGAEPVCLTPGDFDESSIAWSPDGAEVAFVSARHPERSLDPGDQVFTMAAAGGDAVAATGVGLWSVPSYDAAGTLHAIGVEDRWAGPDVRPLHRVGKGPVTTIDRSLLPHAPPVAPSGPQWLDDGGAMCLLEDEGRVRIVRIGGDGSIEDLAGGDRIVTGVSPTRDGRAVVFTVATPTSPGEVHWLDDGGERAVTDLNGGFADAADLVEPRRFTIEHDGAVVEGWIYMPPGDAKVPLLVNIHGGPATQYGYGFFDEFQVYVGAGYGVVAANPRGSSGYGRDHMRAIVGRWDDDMPPDLVDLLALADRAAELEPRFDVERMGVMGGSYGGYATVRVIARDHRFRSAVAERGLYSFTSFAGTSDIGPWFDRQYLDGSLPDDWDRWWKASPLSEAHEITTPTLVLHSDGDWRCPVEQAQQLFVMLLRAGVDTELVRFPEDEGHELSRSGKPRHRLDRFEAILEWHGRHLGS
jgi:dipeptidyl aminopeptidase/acylaminoacyl peptidase